MKAWLLSKSCSANRTAASSSGEPGSVSRPRGDVPRVSGLTLRVMASVPLGWVLPTYREAQGHRRPRGSAAALGFRHDHDAEGLDARALRLGARHGPHVHAGD